MTDTNNTDGAALLPVTAEELRDHFPAGERIGVRLSAGMFSRILTALSSPLSTPQRQEYDGEAVRKALEDAYSAGWDARHPGAEFYGPRDKYVAAAVKALPAALAHPAQATPSAVSGDAANVPVDHPLAKGLRTSQKTLDEIARQEQANIAGYLALRDFPIGSPPIDGEGE